MKGSEVACRPQHFGIPSPGVRIRITLLAHVAVIYYKALRQVQWRITDIYTQYIYKRKIPALTQIVDSQKSSTASNTGTRSAPGKTVQGLGGKRDMTAHIQGL